MNHKRCALRNDLKERAIRMLATGTDIEIFSHLIENEEGKSFLDSVADDLEKKIETSRGGKMDYDTLSMDEILACGKNSIYPEDIKKTLSRTILTLIKNGDATIKMDASQKWITAKGVIDTEMAINDLYIFEDTEIKEMVLNAFIKMVIEESNKEIAGYRAVTEGCKKKGIDKEQYRNWLE